MTHVRRLYLTGVPIKRRQLLVVGRRTSKLGPPVAAVDTPGIVSAASYKKFWISWAGGVIRVGDGWTVGTGEFMQYADPTPSPVNAVSVTGWDQLGTIRVYY